MFDHCTDTTDNRQPGSLAGIVAVEPAGAFMRVFRRDADDLTFHDQPFRPFVLLTDQAQSAAFPVPTTSQRLSGAGELCRYITTDTWHHWLQLREHLQRHYPPDSWYALADSRQQFLVASGNRLFEGLSCEQLRILCLSVAHSAGTADDKSTTQDEQDVLTAIALTNTDGSQLLLTSADGGEAALLTQLSVTIQERDPDIITGYSLNRTILPLLLKRARKHHIRLAWGRNGSLIQATEQHRQMHYEVYGRSCVDCSLLIRQYDRLAAAVPAGDLLQTALWFGCPAAEGYPTVMAEAHAAHALFRQLFPAWHRLLQLTPLTLQVAVTRSGLSVAAALLAQHYLMHRQALPGYPAPMPSAEKATQQTAFRTGRFAPVEYCELRFLPTALLLAYRIAPSSDKLQLFLPSLRKCMQHCAADQRQLNGRRMPLAALLLPPWHELLAQHHPFGDQAAGHELARLERVVTRDIVSGLESEHLTPLLHERQGIYCLTTGAAKMESTVRTVLQQAGLQLLPDTPAITSYNALFCYKPDNFALLHQDGSISFRGNSFYTSRRETFLREFLRQAVTLLLEDRAGEVQQVYRQLLQRLVARDCPIDWVSRSEQLLDTPEHYRQTVLAGTRNRSAAYELALRIPEQWHRGDTVRYYITGSSKLINAHEYCKLTSAYDPVHPDINSAWYVERLHLLYKRLVSHLGPEPLLF